MDITRSLGTILILISLALFVHIYYPVLIQEINFRTSNQALSDQVIPKSSEFGLIIYRLGINEVVTPNVDPFNPHEYLPVLSNNLAHAQNSSLPGELGTIYIFGHSSDNPLSITSYNTSFFLLSKLKPGDKITLYFHQQPYHYQVESKKVVSPQEVGYLTQSEANQLILQTCTPIGTSLNRLLVFAKPIQPQNPQP